MGYSERFRRPKPLFICCALTLAFLALTAPLCCAQTSPSEPPPSASPFPQDFNQYPGLLPAFGEFAEKLQHNMQFPPDRSQSRLLPLLPASTNIYLALPNYGEVAHHALDAFHQQMKESTALRDWWAHGEMLKNGPKIEDALDEFSQVSEFLGEEIVISGAIEEKAPHLLIVAEVRKPGLKEMLQQMLQRLDTTGAQHIRIIDSLELAAADRGSKDNLLILVRPDFVVAATDLPTLRAFNGTLDHPNSEFATTAFGQRIGQSYAGGLTSVGAADIQSILRQMPKPKDQKAFERTGFSDLKYFVWEHKTIAGAAISHSELSFTGPRRGIAAWLAAPTTLGSLEFVSPKAMMTASVVLNDPAQMFDDIMRLTAGSDPRAQASLAQTEQGLGINLKDDLLSQLSGELTVELDSFTPPQPQWKVILGVKNPSRFQQTLKTSLTAAHLKVEQHQDNGITYQMVGIPGPKGVNPIGLAFVGKYLIIASDPDALVALTHLRDGNESLAKSSRFLAALPPGHTGLSAMMYQDPTAMTALQLQRIAPGLASSFPRSFAARKPAVVAVYADETSISESSSSPAFDAGAVLVVAAIAIPNLLRSRMAANEASAVGSLRTINTAQIVYASNYPDHGFAADLASLGPDPKNSQNNSEEHAGLLDASLANSSCPAGKWCEKSGYRFTTKAMCGLGTCSDYVAVASPAAPNTGTRSFCSTSDGIIRYHLGSPLKTQLTVRECHTWQPLK